MQTEEKSTAQAADEGLRQRPAGKLAALIAHPALHAAVVIALVWVCFGRTLTSYFLADDFGEIQYVSRICNGDYGRLWANFTGNYMQIPGMNVWRPWLLVTLIADFLVWKGNAAGYYLTNLLFYSADVALIYAVSRTLTKTWPAWRSALAALFAAALFAVNPLHCESVSWVVGRVDIISLFFTLAAFLIVARQAGRPAAASTAAALACFWLGLWTKEMAIGLPAIVTAYAFLWAGDNTGAAGPSLRLRLAQAGRLSAPFWLATAGYFALRLLFLGTVTGGYTAGFGASQAAAMVQRWADADTVSRLFIPLNHALFPPPSFYAATIAGAYAVLAAVIAVRLLAGELGFRWPLLLTAWAAAAAAPVFQLWGLGHNLEGARFCFFLTVPLSLLIPALVFKPSRLIQAGEPQASKLNKRLCALAAAALVLITAVFARVAYTTNLAWVHAGKEVRSLAAAAENLAQALAAGEKAVILGIPKQRAGAHMILNGDTFAVMLGPPFRQESLADRIITFEPVMFGPADKIDGTRLKDLLAREPAPKVFVWHSQDRSLRPVAISKASRPALLPADLSLSRSAWRPYSRGHALARASGQALELLHVKNGDGIRADALQIDPAAAGFLEFELSVPASLPPPLPVTVGWRGASPAGETEPFACRNLVPAPGGASTTCRVRLSDRWRWFADGRIESLFLLLPDLPSARISGLRLRADEEVMPAIEILSLPCSPQGVYDAAAGALRLRARPRQVSGARAVRVEISKTNFFFDTFGDSEAAAAVATTRIASAPDYELALSPADLPATGYYQLRARCLDDSGAPLGEFSDCMTLRR